MKAISQVLIYLTDYKINFRDHHSKLNDLGYCPRIKQEINRQPSYDSSRPVMARIVGIGFDYDVEKNVNLHRCLGDEIYSARDFNHLYDLIIGLLAEEIGHLHRS